MTYNVQQASSSAIMGRPRHRLKVFTAAVLVMAGLQALSVTHAGPKSGIDRVQKAGERPALALTTSERQRVEQMLAGELQRVVDGQKRLEGQSKSIRVKVTLDVASQAAIIELGKGYVPKHHGAAFADLQSELTTTLVSLVQGVVAVNEVRFTYAGRNISHYFPAEQARTERRINTTAEPAELVVVSRNR